MANMSQTLALLVLFVGALALLPWLVRRLQQRGLADTGAMGAGVRVLHAAARSIWRSGSGTGPRTGDRPRRGVVRTGHGADATHAGQGRAWLSAHASSGKR